MRSMNGVASPSRALMHATLESRHSTRCPMVMRQGMAWGLMMRSGTMPSHVKGMSSWVYVMPTVPFCPCRDANLSPTCGVLMVRVRTLTNFVSRSGVLVIIT